MSIEEKASLPTDVQLRNLSNCVEGGIQDALKIYTNATIPHLGKEPRIYTEPEAVLEDVQDMLDATKATLPNKPKESDWQKKMGCKPIKATDLQPLIDEPIPFLVDPLIARGFLTQIQGVPKGGKSAFSIYLALCATTGTWLHPSMMSASGPLKVLYIAWEDPEIMMAKRLSLYGAGIGFDRLFMPSNLTFLFAPDLFVDRVDHAQALRDAIEELQVDIVFVDTLSQIHASDENSATEMKLPMRELTAIAKQMDIGIVYIHHTAKGSGINGKTTVDKGRGSGTIGAAWHVLIDWGIREKGSNVNPVEIQTKLGHEWKYWEVEYQVQKDEFGTVQAVVWGLKPKDEAEAVEKLPSTTKKRVVIMNTLKNLSMIQDDGWVTSILVTNACSLGMENRSVKDHLKDLCALGEVISKVAPDNKTLLFKPSGV